MPLLKKMPFALVATPEDLKPHEEVWQIRFTGEIFRDYSEYLSRLNLFRQRMWTCSTTGKGHLTYEEALVSEQQANARVQQFPENFKSFVLHNVQYSTLKINELATIILEKLKNTYVKDEELLGKIEDSFHPCKITKILTCKGGTSYEVDWLGEPKKSSSTLEENELCRKKIPFTKNLLRLFIKESTFHNNPWIVRNDLVKLYGLTSTPPPEIADKIIIQPGVDAVTSKKLKGKENLHPNTNAQPNKTVQKENQLKIEKIVYPIEDLLVKPDVDDPTFSARPVPSVNFLIPNDEVGKLLMVWDFLSYFSKNLRLSPFSLSDFEEAVSYNGESSLIVEAHVALLTLLIKENDKFNSFIEQRGKEEKIALNAWVDYLCDYLEMDTGTEFANHIANIKHGKYFSLHVHDKLEILSNLINQAITTESIKGEVDDCIQKQIELKADKREEDLEEIRKKREAKRLKKETNSEIILGSMNSDEKPSMEVPSSCPSVHQSNGGSKLDVLASRRAIMMRNLALEKEKEIVKRKELQKMREESRAKAEEAKERNLKRKRNELFELEMEKLQRWPNSLGKDRDYNTYWFFKRDGRLFVQSLDDKNWGFYSSKEELDSLICSLNPKGVRELALKNRLEKYYTSICTAFQKRSKQIIRKAKLEDTSVLRRSIRVSAPQKNEQDAPSFLKYVNILRK